MHQNAAPAIPLEFLALAPNHLANHRHDRFRGDAQRVSLGHFHPEDQTRLRTIYSHLQTLLVELRPCVGDDGRIRAILIRQAASRDQIARNLEAFGGKTVGSRAPLGVAQIIHDLRGGALFALLLRWEMFLVEPDKTGLSPFFFLVRDHLKIMRNCVGDLDPDRFHADESRKDHGTDLLLEKWSNAEFYGGTVPARIQFTCAYQGTVCESCLEFSTLDRIVYNLVNNAARYADDHVVRFFILPVQDDEAQGGAENLRFVISNRVKATHRETLNQAVGDLGQLFQSDFTTGGHGIGTQIVGEFCAQAYGVMESEAARRQGYFGARWLDDTFVVWFHWPIAGL